MCQAIYQPIGVTLGKEQLHNSWKKNPDGGGFAYIGDDGVIRVFKSLDCEEFVEVYHDTRKRNHHTPFLVHTRIGTSGTMDEYSCHPFQVDEHTVMIHNGVLNVLWPGKEDMKVRSDSRVFAEDYLPRFPKNWLDDPWIVDLVQKYTTGSKLVFLTTNPELSKPVYIIHEKSGQWDRGAWWSNNSHKAPFTSNYWSKSKGTGGKGVSKAGGVTSVKAGAKVTPPPRVTEKQLEEFDKWEDWYYNGEISPGTDYSIFDPICNLCEEEIIQTDPFCMTCEWCSDCDMSYWECEHAILNDRFLFALIMEKLEDERKEWLEANEY